MVVNIGCLRQELGTAEKARQDKLPLESVYCRFGAEFHRFVTHPRRPRLRVARAIRYILTSWGRAFNLAASARPTLPTALDNLMRTGAAVIASVICILCRGPLEAQSCAAPVGVWHNQLKSTLTITKADSATGQLVGTYVSPSGGGVSKYPLVGWYASGPSAPAPDTSNRTLISFSVNFAPNGVITSWTATCETDPVSKQPRLVAMWHLARVNTVFPWDHIVTNEDVFTPGPAPGR